MPATSCPTVQAQAILDLRLHRLTGLEQDKIAREYSDIIDNINYFLQILSDPDKLQEVIRSELDEVRERYVDARRTEIVEDYNDLTIEDLIPEASLVVTLSHAGYAKAQPVEAYQAQRRGGRGRAAARSRTRTSSTSFSSRIRTTRCCASRAAARCTGSRSTSYRRRAPARAGGRS
jgi:DNA gyrase/topoisomerase IV subunit A